MTISAKNHMWLIKLSDILNSQKTQVIKEIYAEVMYQRSRANGLIPEEMIVPLMRYLKDEYQEGYIAAKGFIEEKYEEHFPNQYPLVSVATLNELKKLD